MASRPMWTGSISFGLVNIPVKLHSVTREERVAFHLLHDQDKVRLRRKIVSSTNGKEVHPEHIIKGFEVEKGRFVVIRQEEIEGCAPEKSKLIEIADFVDEAEIDPIYYDRPYFIVPQAGAAKSYRLLLEAMKRQKKVAVARFVFHEKEYLAAIRPVGEALCLETMYFHHEIVPFESLDIDLHHGTKVPEREAKAAREVIQANLVDFDPSRYHDRHLKVLKKMLAKKAEGEHVTPPPPAKEKEKKTARAGDLMAALEASLAAAKDEAGDASHHRRRRKSA